MLRRWRIAAAIWRQRRRRRQGAIEGRLLHWSLLRWGLLRWRGRGCSWGGCCYIPRVFPPSSWKPSRQGGPTSRTAVAATVLGWCVLGPTWGLQGICTMCVVVHPMVVLALVLLLWVVLVVLMRVVVAVLVVRVVMARVLALEVLLVGRMLSVGGIARAAATTLGPEAVQRHVS